MDYSKPTLFVISGPNGAEKSTHIQLMLPNELKGLWSFDRDKTRKEFESRLVETKINASEIAILATKLMEDRLVEEMKQAVINKTHFVLETPLSHPDYWRYIDFFERYNYQIHLNYLCLDNIGDCILRVGQRVANGGHHVEPATICGVYEKNLEFVDQYRNTFSLIELYDGMKLPVCLVKIENDQITYANKLALKKIWIKSGLPSIAKNINSFLSAVKP